MLIKKAYTCLLEWEPIHEIIMTARFHSKFQEVTIIQCYAPTNVADKDVKEEFYQQLHSVLEGVPRRDVTILMGDMNAKVGSNTLEEKKSWGMRVLER